MTEQAWIDIKPTCSVCGAELPFAVVREDMLKSPQGYLYKSYQTRPATCPKCNSKFVGIRVRKEHLEDGI